MPAFSKPVSQETDGIATPSFCARVRKLRIAAATRRRQILAALLTRSGGQGPQGAKYRTESPFSWNDHVKRLTESEFKLRYRLDFDAFQRLVEILRPDLSVQSEKLARRAKWGQLVLPETKLAIALRFLCRGQPLDLKLIYDVSVPYVYDCTWLVVGGGGIHGWRCGLYAAAAHVCCSCSVIEAS